MSRKEWTFFRTLTADQVNQNIGRALRCSCCTLFYLKKINHQETTNFTWKCFYCFHLNLVWKVCKTSWIFGYHCIVCLKYVKTFSSTSSNQKHTRENYLNQTWKMNHQKKKCLCFFRASAALTSILFTKISMMHFPKQWIVDQPNVDLLFCSMISVPAAGEQYCHFCEEWAEKDQESSEFRLPRVLRESGGGYRGDGWWGGGEEEEQQRGLSKDHTYLPEENEAGGAGWPSAEQ